MTAVVQAAQVNVTATIKAIADIENQFYKKEAVSLRIQVNQGKNTKNAVRIIALANS